MSIRRSAHGGDIYENQVKYDFSVNTNFLPLAESVREKIAQSVIAMDCYPQYQNVRIRQAIAQTLSLSDSQVLCGNGASELFAAVIHAVRPQKVVIPLPSFSGYQWAAHMVDAEICFGPLREENNFEITDGILAFLEGAQLLFLASPANPVGNLIGEPVLREILMECQRRNIIVILDECFIGFTGKKGYAEWIGEFSNLVVVHAFTKLYGIPGIRLGYLIAEETFCAKVERQLPEWNVSTVAQQAGLAILENDREKAWNREQYVEETVRCVRQEREFLVGGLKKILGDEITIFPSEANFLLLKTRYPLYESLLARGILIRDCANYRGLGDGYYRIAVKDHAANEILLKILSGVTAHSSLQEPWRHGIFQ